MGSQKVKFTVATSTTEQQEDTEKEIAPFYIDLTKLTGPNLAHLREVGLLAEDGFEVRLLREKHVKYLTGGLEKLGSGYVSLDASRPWIAYWCLHGLDLLEAAPVEMMPRIVDTLGRFQNATGGFGGGPAQISHGAPTYASCLALLLIAPSYPKAYDAIDRRSIYKWFLSMKRPNGGFMMHDDGETDVRASYTVIAIAKLLNLLTPELMEGVAEYILQCQTYEGGFGGEPGNECHGGYAYCAVAALQIMGKLGMCDLEGLKGWISRRQMGFEGGFAGRANKLVDGCYSFWQGGAMAIVDAYEGGMTEGGFGTGVTEYVAEVGEEGADVSATTEAKGPISGELSFDQAALQRYTLLCGQHVEGGLRDKPSKARDFYHSCYSLSGLSVSQHGSSKDGVPLVYGDARTNVLKPTHECFNIRVDRVEKARERFKDDVCNHDDLIS